MTQRHAAIDFYHELCTTGSLAQDTWEVLYPGLRARGLVFGGRPLTTVLRPLLHTGMDWHYLRWRSTLTLSVFRKMADAMLVDPVLRAQVYLTPEEEELIQIPTGFPTVLPTARLDSFFTVYPDGAYKLNYVELNGESPASMAYSDVLAELFLETPLMQHFQERYHVDMIPGRRHAVDALLRIYFSWRGNRDKLPDIAIVDWKGCPPPPSFTSSSTILLAMASKPPSATPTTWSGATASSMPMAAPWIMSTNGCSPPSCSRSSASTTPSSMPCAPGPSAWRTRSPARWSTRKPALPSPPTNATPTCSMPRSWRPFASTSRGPASSRNG